MLIISEIVLPTNTLPELLFLLLNDKFRWQWRC